MVCWLAGYVKSWISHTGVNCYGDSALGDSSQSVEDVIKAGDCGENKGDLISCKNTQYYVLYLRPSQLMVKIGLRYFVTYKLNHILQNVSKLADNI